MVTNQPRVVVLSQYASSARGLVVGCLKAGITPIAAIGVRAREPGGSVRSPARTIQVKAMLARVPIAVPVIGAGGLDTVTRVLQSLSPDLLLTRGFPWKLPAEALQVPRLGAVNIHPAPLPKYRGAFPVHHAIFNGDTELVATAHRMTDVYDAGNIVARDSVALPADVVGADIWEIVDHVADMTVAPAVEAALRGAPGEVQDETAVSLAEQHPCHLQGSVDPATVSRQQLHSLARVFSLDGPRQGVPLRTKAGRLKARGIALDEPAKAGYPLDCLDGRVWLIDYDIDTEDESP